MSNRHCGPDIVKYFVVEPSTGGSITGSTGDFFVCDGVLFTNTISGCTDNVTINGNVFNGDGSVLFNSSITACTAIHTTNLYGCSPITIHDLALFLKGIEVISGDTILLTTSATTFTLTDVPNLNNTATQILTRNTTTGLVEYRDVSSITPDTNTFVTGTTFGSNQALLTRNDGFDVLKLSGGSNVTLSNPSTNQIKIDVSIPPDTNTFVTGGTYNPSTDTITLTRNDSVQIDITGVTDTFTTGGTYDNGAKLITFVKNDGSNYTVNLSTIDTNDTFTTGFTYDNVNTFTINRNDGVDLSTTITTLSGVTYYGNGIGLTNIPLSGVTNLQTELDSKLNITDFNTYSGSVQTQIDSKLDITTFNTYTGNTQSLLDTKISGATNLSSEGIFAQKNGFDLEFKGLTSTGGTVNISSDSTSVNLEVTFPTDQDKFVSGGTYNGGTKEINFVGNSVDTTFDVDLTSLVSSVSANTFVIAGTYVDSTDTLSLLRNDGNFVNITGITDTFTTGATYDNGTATATFTRNDGNTYTLDLSTIDVNDTFVTGFTYNNANTFTISRNDGVDLNSSFNTVTGLTVNGTLDATTILSGGTNLTTIIESLDTNTFVSGGTYNTGTQEINFVGNSPETTFDVDLSSIISTDTYVTGFTFNPSTYDLTIRQNEGQPDLVSNLAVLATDVYVVSGVYNPATGIVTYTNSSGGTFQVSGFTTGMTDSYTTDAYLSGTEIRFDNNIQGVNFYNVDLLPVLSGKTDLTLFNSHTADTNNPHQTSFNNLTSTAHTHTISDVINLQTELDSKLDITTFNTYTANTQTILDGKIDSANNVGGANEFFKDKSGTTLNFRTLSGGSNTTVSTIGDVVKIDTVDLFTTGATYNNGTALATFTKNDGTTYTLDLSSIDVNDTFITGFTYNDANTFTLNRNDGVDLSASINNVTGFTINGDLLVTDNTTLSGLTIVYGDTPTSSAIQPGVNNTYDLGSPSFRWREIWTTNLDATNTITTFSLFATNNVTVDNDLVVSGNTRLIGSSDYESVVTGINPKEIVNVEHLTGYVETVDAYVTGNTYTSSTDNTNQTTYSLLYHGNPLNTPHTLNGEDTFVTGGTYDNGTALITFTKNDSTTFNVDLSPLDLNDTYVTGGTLTQPTNNTNSGLINLLYSQDVSPATYTLPYTDTFITGFTYNNNNTFTIVENNGNSFSSTFNEVSGLTVNGTLDVIGNLNVTGTTFYTNITGTSIGVDYIDFNNALAPLPADLEGRIYWDSDNGTLSLGMEGGNVVQQIGLEQYYYIKNQSGATISNGRVVRAAGTLGSSGRILGEYMIADGTIPAKFTLGIATENIVNGDDGYVTQFGLVRGIDASGSLYGESWSGGTILYVSPTIPGGLTSVEPTAPDLKIEMAIVIDADANGSIFVRPSRYPHIYDLQEVNYSVGTENNLDILQWNESNLTWDKTNTPSFSGLTVYNNINHFGNYILDGNISQTGDYNVTGDTTQIGNTTTNGTVDIIGSGTGCTLSVTGKTCLDGDLEITGDVNVIGNLTYDGNLIITGATIITSGLTVTDGVITDFINITTTPTENNDLIQILGRNSSTGDVEYRDVKTIGNNITVVTGSTYSATTTDDVIGIDSSTNTVTLYLPDSVSSGRLRYDIKDIGVNSFVNPITVQAAGSDTIITTSVVSSFELSADGGAVILVNTGTGQWWQM